MNLTATIDFLLSESTLEWKNENFFLWICSSLDFYYEWRHSFYFKGFRKEFLFNLAVSGLQNLLFISFLKISEVKFEALNKKIIDVLI